MKKEENLLEGTVLSKNPGCNLMNLILEDGLDFSVYELNSGEDVTNHLVHFNKLSRPDLLKIKKNSKLLLPFDKVNFWVETQSCKVCKQIAQSAAIPINVRVNSTGEVKYKIIFPSLKQSESFRSSLESVGINFEFTVNDNQFLKSELTTRQKFILVTAYKMGYFAVDREISLTNLSDKIGISPSSLEETIRRILLKLIQNYFFEMP
jgi:predicted DNA binding protein